MYYIQVEDLNQINLTDVKKIAPNRNATICKTIRDKIYYMRLKDLLTGLCLLEKSLKIAYKIAKKIAVRILNKCY